MVPLEVAGVGVVVVSVTAVGEVSETAEEAGVVSEIGVEAAASEDVVVSATEVVVVEVSVIDVDVVVSVTEVASGAGEVSVTEEGSHLVKMEGKVVASVEAGEASGRASEEMEIAEEAEGEVSEGDSIRALKILHPKIKKLPLTNKL